MNSLTFVRKLRPLAPHINKAVAGAPSRIMMFRRPNKVSQNVLDRDFSSHRKSVHMKETMAVQVDHLNSRLANINRQDAYLSSGELNELLSKNGSTVRFVTVDEVMKLM